MNKKWNLLTMLAMGLVGCGLYYWVFTHLDESELLIRGTAPEILLWLLVAGAAGFGFIASRDPVSGPNRILTPLGDLIFALGALSLLRFTAKGPGPLVLAYHIITIAAALSLAAMAITNALGRKPFFLLQVMPCLLCMVQLVECYQLWSEMPMLLNYFFGLGAMLALTLFSYHRMAFAAKLGASRMYSFSGLIGIFLCTVAVMQPEFRLFFGASAIWLLTSRVGE